jgi:adenylate kinase family enzyme
MRRIIIVGVPATGKTTIGNYLETKLGFRHFDVECEDANPHSNVLGQLFWGNKVAAFIDAVGAMEDIVVTWGFVSDHQHSINIIRTLQESGSVLFGSPQKSHWRAQRLSND